VWRSLEIEEKIQHLIITDRSGSVILEEILTRDDQIHNLEVGFAELVITTTWYI